MYFWGVVLSIVKDLTKDVVDDKEILWKILSKSNLLKDKSCLSRMMSIIVLTFLLLNMPRCVIGLFEATR